MADPRPPRVMTKTAPMNIQSELSDVIGVFESLKANAAPTALSAVTRAPTRIDHNASIFMMYLLFSPNTRCVDNLDNFRREAKTMEPRCSPLVEPSKELEQNETCLLYTSPSPRD